jgi:hypothetical protein
MNEINKGKICITSAVIFGVLFLFAFFKIIGLSAESKNLRAENIKLTTQAGQLNAAMKEKDEKIEFERNLYTSLAARLHKEQKRVAELEAQVKK